MPQAACPLCQVALRCATNVEDKLDATAPRPGDLTVCIHCAAILRFDDELIPVRLAAADLAALDADTSTVLLRTVRATTLAMRARRSAG